MKKIPYSIGRDQELDSDYYDSELKPDIERQEKYNKAVDDYKNRKKKKPKEGQAFQGIRNLIGK
jgi:hypothetical protein